MKVLREVLDWQRLLQHPHWMGGLLVLLLTPAAILGRTQAMPAFASAWVWPASGLCLAYLWMYGARFWPYVFLGTALTLVNAKLAHPLLYLLNPLLAALAAAVPVGLMGTLQDQHRRSMARMLWGLLVYGIVLATVLRSGLNALALMLLDVAPPQLFSVRLPAWAASSALGVLLVVVPVMGALLRLEAGRKELHRAPRPAQAVLGMAPLLLLETLRLSAAPEVPWSVAALAAGVLMQLVYSWHFGGRWGSLLVLAVSIQIGLRLPLLGDLDAQLLPALQTWVYVTLLALLNLGVMLVQSHWGTRIALLQQGLHGGGVMAWWWQPQSGRYGTAGDWQALSGRAEAPPAQRDALFERVLPADRDGLREAHARRLAGGPVVCEFRLQDAAGRLRWLRETGEVVQRDATGQPLHVAGLLQDVSASREAREQLALSEQRYRTLSSVAPVGVFQSRPEGEVLYVNAEYAAMLGTTAEACLGMGWARHLLVADWDEALTAWRQATAAGERFEGESQMRRSDGRLIWVMARAQPVRDAAGAVLSYVGSLTDITEQKEQQALIWTQAHVDALTGLPNRRLFADRLEQALQHAQRQSQRLALLYIDLDRFKEINDTLGHGKGDELLVAAAQRIRDSVRTSDTTARLGGDEFTVVLSDLHGSHPVDAVASKLVETLSRPFRLGDDTVYVSASVGITLYPDDGDSVLELMKHADQALYRAKSEGRNRFSYFTAAMQEQAQLALALTQELRAALGTPQLALHFQPIVELTSGRMVKAEALCRWQHPTRGAVSPAQFVPLAEESGLIHPLGDWVFAEAVRAAQAWRARHGRVLPINVNKSPRQFLAGDSESDWPARLRDAGLPTDAVCIEITEGLLLDERPDVALRVQALASAGLCFAVDDFGTGYSAMAYLKKFPIQQLKIDRSFVQGIAERSADLAIVEAIVAMAHKLGLIVVAEGVETEAQATLLRQAGCDLAQGWHFGRPMPLEALLALQA